MLSLKPDEVLMLFYALALLMVVVFVYVLCLWVKHVKETRQMMAYFKPNTEYVAYRVTVVNPNPTIGAKNFWKVYNDKGKASSVFNSKKVWLDGRIDNAQSTANKYVAIGDEGYVITYEEIVV